MSSGTPPAAALELARQLKIVLGEEFDALANDDLARFEKLGEAKAELIVQLDIIGRNTTANSDSGWSDLRAEMISCKTLHRRNETLLRAKLDSIKAALQLLQRSADPDNATEIYDRLGRVAHAPRRRRLGDA
jgi:flagellar biosynthesis/type III secretory pathway chaperone